MTFGRYHSDTYEVLRDERLHWRQRTPWLESLHAAVYDSFDAAGNWAPSDDGLDVP